MNPEQVQESSNVISSSPSFETSCQLLLKVSFNDLNP